MIDRDRGESGDIAEVATGSYFGDMKVVGIKELKNKLSEYVKLAKAGEVIAITDRGEVVAELRARTTSADPLLDDPWFREQVRLGHITPAKHWGPLPELVRDYPLMSLEEILRDLDESREEGP